MLARVAYEQSQKEEKVRIVERIKRIPVPGVCPPAYEETIDRETTKDTDSHRTTASDATESKQGSAVEVKQHQEEKITKPVEPTWRIAAKAGWDSADLKWRPELTAEASVKLVGPFHVWAELAPPIVNETTRLGGGVSLELTW
jgi:hypothetical protein